MTLSLCSLFNVEGYVAVVTGGGTGIGYWTAEALVQNGATVYITGRREDVLKEAKSKLNALSNTRGRAIFFTGDVTCRKDVNNLVNFVAERECSVDLVVNNAGTVTYETSIQHRSGLAELQLALLSTPQEDWTSQYAVNTWGPHLITTAFLPLLAKAAAKGNGRGSVIFVSSVTARFWNPNVNVPAYMASKAAVEHLAKVFSAKLYPYGIRVNVLAPGSYPSGLNPPSSATAMSHPTNDVNIPLGRSGTAEDIAGTVLWLASRAGAYVTGETIDVDGGLMLVANGTNQITPQAIDL